MRLKHLTLYIVDADAAFRERLSDGLVQAGHRTASFSNAEAFLDAWRDDWVGCVVTDLNLPGKSGIELQQALRSRSSALPVIVLSATADLSAIRSAFLAGAVDFLLKPIDFTQLRRSVEAALAAEDGRAKRNQLDRSNREKLALLTSRERDVLARVGHGMHTKAIGAALSISPRTVDIHKNRIMEKLGIRNIEGLVRFAITVMRTSGDES